MTADDADYVPDCWLGEYRLGAREQLGRAFGGFWRSLLATSIGLAILMVPAAYATTPWIASVRESTWLGLVVNLGAFGVAVGYAYACASTKYVVEVSGIRIVRRWPLPATSFSRKSISTARLVGGMFSPLLRLELRSGRVVKLVVPETLMKRLDFQLAKQR